MEVYFKNEDQEFIADIKNQLCNGLNELFKNVELGERKVRPRAEANPTLHGYWGDGLYTMTQ